MTFNLEKALKGTTLVTRDNTLVTHFKANPDRFSPKPYIAMVGDELIYYNASGWVNPSGYPHKYDLFIKD